MNNDLKGLSKEEIIKVFEAYDFKDKIGHPLTMCMDFLDLIDLRGIRPDIEDLDTDEWERSSYARKVDL